MDLTPIRLICTKDEAVRFVREELYFEDMMEFESETGIGIDELIGTFTFLNEAAPKDLSIHIKFKSKETEMLLCDSGRSVGDWYIGTVEAYLGSDGRLYVDFEYYS